MLRFNYDADFVLLLLRRFLKNFCVGGGTTMSRVIFYFSFLLFLLLLRSFGPERHESKSRYLWNPFLPFPVQIGHISDVRFTLPDAKFNSLLSINRINKYFRRRKPANLPLLACSDIFAIFPPATLACCCLLFFCCFLRGSLSDPRPPVCWSNLFGLFQT